ncbi:MAG: sialidase family protein [Actinomycetota bacterium]
MHGHITPFPVTPAGSIAASGGNSNDREAAPEKGEAEPGEAEPGEPEPGEAEPGEAEPGEAQPGEAEPGEAEPGEAEPGEAEPAEAEPGEAEPAEAEPAEAEPGEAEPAEAEPGEAEPGEAEPGEAEPAEALADEGDTFAVLQTAISSNPAALGERLLVIGSGPISVRGALGGVLALDERGAGVLVALFAALPPGAATDLADELDRLGQLTGQRLNAAAELPVAELTKLHRTTFNGTSPGLLFLNRTQRTFVVVTQPPGIDTWNDLRSGLGRQFAGVRVLREGSLEPEPVPDILRKTERVRSFRRWLAGATVAALLTGILIGRALESRDPGQAGPGPLFSTSALVATDAPADATHTQWIGQRRVVRTSDGRLIAAYNGPGGLQVVSDKGNQGRSWHPPQPIAGLSPASFALAIDPTDRLHVAFRDEQGVGYVIIAESEIGLTPGEVVRLDRDATSPVVDVAYDQMRSAAHVVWVKGDPGQQPFWAAISAPVDGEPAVLATQELSAPGDVLSVLANVGTGPAGEVLATYRRGDSLSGWYSRSLGSDALTWSGEEALPVPEALYGAASLAMDRAGTGHLVLRDNTSYELTYLTKAAAGGWLPPEQVLDADVTEQIDFPTIAVDETSSTLFVVFQDTESNPEGEIKAVTWEPEGGWSIPSVVATGSGLPTSIERAGGVAQILSTRRDQGTIEAVRVGAG